MKLSEETLNILSNFASVNPSIVIKEGQTLSTIANNGSILATAKCPDKFESEIAIYDLPSFLSILSLIEEPVIEVEDSAVVIAGGNSKYRFYMADKSLIKSPPKDSIDLPSEDIEFGLTESVIKKVVKAASIFRLENVCFYSDDDSLFFGVQDSAVKNSDSFSVCVLEDYDGPKLRLFVSLQKLTLLPGDYSVTGCFAGRRKLLRFDNQSSYDVKYWIPVETDSTVGEE